MTHRKFVHLCRWFKWRHSSYRAVICHRTLFYPLCTPYVPLLYPYAGVAESAHITFGKCKYIATKSIRYMTGCKLFAAKN